MSTDAPLPEDQTPPVDVEWLRTILTPERVGMLIEWGWVVEGDEGLTEEEELLLNDLHQLPNTPRQAPPDMA